jgi:glycine/D-amino acid oxidase-like deaminating enzyme
MTTADVLIIGAGLAGCSVAWHLAPHRSVLLLEQGPQPGSEASAQNAGMVRRLGEDPYERLLAQRTWRWLEEPAEDWVDRPRSRVTGALMGLVHDPLHLHDAVSHSKSSGVDVLRCDRPAEVAPVLAGAHIRAAWYLPDERVADAHSLVHGFLAGAGRHGARHRCNSRVTGVLQSGGRLLGVETSDGPVYADQVVIAAGAWSGVFARELGLNRPLIPLRRTLHQSRPHPLSDPSHPWVWLDDVGLYVRPEGEGWLASGCDEAVELPGEGSGSRGTGDRITTARLMEKVDRWMPALSDLRFASSWTGLRTFAPDRRPVLGPDPELSGLHWAAGLGGFGVTCSYAVGEFVADLLRGRAPEWMRSEPISPGRSYLKRWAIRPTGELSSMRLIPG